ncbi:hypothetical protein BaRGS_00023484, partial [Batillaria attramentaria]
DPVSELARNRRSKRRGETLELPLYKETENTLRWPPQPYAGAHGYFIQFEILHSTPNKPFLSIPQSTDDGSPRGVKPYITLSLTHCSPRGVKSYITLSLTHCSPRGVKPYTTLSLTHCSPRGVKPYITLSLTHCSPRGVKPYITLSLTDCSPRGVKPYITL